MRRNSSAIWQIKSDIHGYGACNIYNRTDALTDEAIERIVQTFEEVNKEWLAEGTGDMYKKES